MIDCDFLVIGSGIAGLTYALKVSEHGSVVLVTKKNDTESATNYAQGGIAAVLGSDDSFKLHLDDTLKAGAGLCHPDVVHILVADGPGRIQELMEMGVRFTEEMVSGNARPALGREGGHSRRRIVHAADLTGREVERALLHQCKQRNSIRLFENQMVIELAIAGEGPDSVCCGAYVLDTESGKAFLIRSKLTMLSTGGLGRAYLRTTNPSIATGDGVAFAYWAGARVGNMEFIQFHPTSLCHDLGDSFLISEAVRGEGAQLRLKDGSTFMERYHEMGCLAPRDIVARAIDSELKASGEECVFLDVTHLEADYIKQRFPGIYSKCLSLGLDISRQQIPVVPAAHYACGGVRTDTSGRTDIRQLYATGEVSFTGVHGANRLASNSLLEAVVFSHRAAADSARSIKDCSSPAALPDFPQEQHSRPVPREVLKELTLRLRTVLWVYAGIVRATERLNEALQEIHDIGDEMTRLYKGGKLSRELLELRTLSTVAELIVCSALSRHESRGLHYNVDHPDRDDVNWRHDTLLVRSKQPPYMPELLPAPPLEP